MQAEAPNVDPVNDEAPNVAHAADAAIEDPTPLVLPESRVNSAAEKEGQLHRVRINDDLTTTWYR